MLVVKMCWKLKSGTWKCTCCIIQMSYLYVSDFPFKNVCNFNMQKQYQKNVWEKEWWGILVINKSTDHVSIYFYCTTITTSKKMFCQSANCKRHHATNWCEQRGMDSYQQWKISQSDSEISSNCFHVNWLVKQAFYCTNNSTISLYIFTVIWTVFAVVR